MSWISKAWHAAGNLLEGKPADLKVVNNPTTPVEHTINAAALVVLPAAAAAAVPVASVIADKGSASGQAVDSVVGSIGALAKSATTTFLRDHIGTGNAALAEAAAEALAAEAIGQMPSLAGKDPAVIQSALSAFLTGFEAG